MRKRIVRKGLQFILAAVLLIVLASYYLAGIAGFLTFTVIAEDHLYSLGIFLAAVSGGYGVVLTVFGLLLPGNVRDAGVRLLPVFLLIITVILLFFFLLVSSFNEPPKPKNVQPGDTITI